jgi:hypothetical protein
MGSAHRTGLKVQGRRLEEGKNRMGDRFMVRAGVGEADFGEPPFGYQQI